MPDEKWLNALRDASDEASWLTAIADADEAATEGLIRRYNLGSYELRSERVEATRLALNEGSLTLNDLVAWRTDVGDVLIAVNGIDDFRQRLPLVQQFRVAKGLGNGDLDTVTGQIRGALWRGEIPLRDWVEFLDSHRREVDRDLFLYRIQSAQLADIQRWLEPQFAATALRQLGIEHLLNSHGYTWRPAEPELVGVDVYPEHQQLLLTWVGWRRWEHEGKNSEEKRCVTFLRLDLSTGVGELQLEHVERGGMRALVAERDLYLRAASAVLGVIPELVQLEPAMRLLMSDERLALESWKVRRPAGGILSGRREADLFEKIKTGLDRFYALELAGEWKITEDVLLTIKLDARTDAVTIKEQCLPETADTLVAAVLQNTTALPDLPVETTPTTSFATLQDARAAELRGLVDKVVGYQRRLGRTEVAIDRLASKEAANDLLLDNQTLQEALDRVGVRYVAATLYVVCPQTQQPVQHGGRDVVFERVSDIPSEIMCENEIGEPQRHITKGNVWLRVGHDQPKAASYVGYIAWIGFLFFLAMATWFFVWLLGRYPQHQYFIIVGYLVSVLGPLAAILRIYGRQNVAAASRILGSFFRSGFGKEERSSAPPKGGSRADES